MNRRRFLQTALTLSLAVLAGCGGGDSSSNAAGRGAAAGFVFRASDGSLRLFASAAQGLAAGLAPAAGVRAQIVGGPSTSVGSDGALRLEGIEAGLRTLQLGSTEFRLTVVPDATLPLGETPVSRTAAIDAVRAFVRSREAPELIEVADILVSSTPLPAGVVVSAALADGSAARTLSAPAWIVYVDFVPQARFGHPTLVALVDAATGAVAAQDSLSWPLFNGASFYARSVVNATSPDAVQVTARPPASRATGAPGIEKNATRETCRAADPDTSRTHVLMIQGDSRDDFAADMQRVDVALSAAPFPAIGTLRKVVTFEGAQTPVAHVLEEFAAVRDACKSGDTFVLFVTAHGTIDVGNVTKQSTSEEIAARYRMEMDASSESQPDGAYYRSEYLTVGDLDFSPCKACRIVVWADTCYAGNWIPLLAPKLEALPDKDILILTAADQLHQAGGMEFDQTVNVNGETITLPTGGAFSSSLLESLSRVRAAGTAETGADALESAFVFAETLTTEQNFLWIPRREPPFNRWTQNPQFFRRPLEEGDVCGRGDQEVTIQ